MTYQKVVSKSLVPLRHILRSVTFGKYVMCINTKMIQQFLKPTCIF